jgi:hypothetical protein
MSSVASGLVIACKEGVSFGIKLGSSSDILKENNKKLFIFLK